MFLQEQDASGTVAVCDIELNEALTLAGEHVRDIDRLNRELGMLKAEVSLRSRSESWVRGIRVRML